jgi:hypothetical protein
MHRDHPVLTTRPPAEPKPQADPIEQFWKAWTERFQSALALLRELAQQRLPAGAELNVEALLALRAAFNLPRGQTSDSRVGFASEMLTHPLLETAKQVQVALDNAIVGSDRALVRAAKAGHELLLHLDDDRVGRAARNVMHPYGARCVLLLPERLAAEHPARQRLIEVLPPDERYQLDGGPALVLGSQEHRWFVLDPQAIRQETVEWVEALGRYHEEERHRREAEERVAQSRRPLAERQVEALASEVEELKARLAAVESRRRQGAAAG